MVAKRGQAGEIIGHVAIVTVEEMRIDEVREFQMMAWSTIVEANAM